MTSRRKLLVVGVAGLGADLVRKHPPAGGPLFRSAESVFPAVTCTVQATMRTGRPPRDHGMIANGLYLRDLRRVMFWEQSAALVQGPRLWRNLRAAGGRVGLLFWQQSLGEEADLLLSPKPVHKHHGGMIQDCYSRPADLYDRLSRKIGRPFNLMHYWGPLASARVNDWIAAATIEVMRSPDLAPDLLFTYLPGLDYDLQRAGPDSRKSFQPACPHPLGGGAGRCLEKTYSDLSNLWKNADAAGYDWLVFGDYAMEPVTGGPVFPNRALRQAGLMSVRLVGGRAYHDLFASAAFAMADHQVAHVYVNGENVGRARAALETLDGVAEILDRAAQERVGLDHPNSGELVLVAAKGRWFAYPWWTDPKEAPDFAAHVDIHNKPGYDPCELFFGWPPMTVSQDPSRVRGTHGRTGPGYEVAWASSLEFAEPPKSLLELAREIVR
ncbi:MAG: alkaline phosphatase family protein [Verrucomicrobiota bacterium]